jgi:hypothetical protein
MGYVPKDPKRAKRLREAEQKIREARSKKVDPFQGQHGNHLTYKNGCRCTECRNAYYKARGMNVKKPNSKPRGK